MPQRTTALLILPLLLVMNCPFFHDVNKLLPQSIRDAASIGIQAIEKSFRIPHDPHVVRFIAVSTATLLADDAMKTIVMRQADKFDDVFGTRSKAVCSMLLNTYCYPILNDIIIAEIDRRLRINNPSPGGDTGEPDLDSIIMSHLADAGLDDLEELAKAFGTPENMPVYDSSIGMQAINSATYAVTRNWKDLGRIYQYRIVNNQLEMKCSDNPWQRFNLPGGRVPRMVAADNNRCFVMTDKHELWWYCVKQDQAQWSIDIMQTAVDLMELKPMIGEGLCGELLPHLINITDSVALQATNTKWLHDWVGAGAPGSSEYWNDKCQGWSEAGLSVDRLLLKTGHGKSFSAKDYTDWSQHSHREGSWTNLLTWTSGDSTFSRGENVPVDSIIDIAVGNWNGTVVTMYILAQGKIWFIDEEIIHPEWKPIENWNAKWAIVENEYYPIGNTPYPLDTSCRIDASNSVIAVAKKSDGKSLIYWLRWDYHQKDDFVYWPLDWCEHGWYAVTCPARKTADFRISTMGTIDPREDNTVWSVPAPAFTFHNYLSREGYRGIFGDIPREAVNTYPVDLLVSDTADSLRSFSIDQTKKVTDRAVEWKGHAP